MHHRLLHKTSTECRKLSVWWSKCPVPPPPRFKRNLPLHISKDQCCPILNVVLLNVVLLNVALLNVVLLNVVLLNVVLLNVVLY